MPAGSRSSLTDRLLGNEHPDNSLEGFYKSVLASLPRRDQRATARMYLRGLLCTEGRKSARNIATVFDGSAAIEQKLQHFVSGSTWDWRLVRGALAREIDTRTSPYAYVARSVVGPRCSAGIARQIRSAPRATGVWTVSPSGSIPVSWRLRRSASHGAIDTHLAAEVWGVPNLPLVFDSAGSDLASIVPALGNRPWLGRIPGAIRLVADDHRLGGRRGHLLTAREIVGILRRTSRSHLSAERGVAAVVGVRAPWADSGELALFGEQKVSQPSTTRLWLTNMVDLRVGDLLRLSRALVTVADDFALIGNRVGVLDYHGRSFDGWHRHVTLASVAYATVAMFGGQPLQDVGTCRNRILAR